MLKNDMNIQWMDINSVKPYERNAKKHPEEQVEHIANSLKRFGWKQPLVIDKDGVIVVGHGRLLGAKLLGLETVPCVLADDLTEAEIKAYRLADNKLNESDWEMDLMDIELDELEELPDIDMSDYGFERRIEPFEEETERISLAERYLVPPFSVLNGAKANWLERKRHGSARASSPNWDGGGDLCFNSPDGWRDSHK